MLGVLEAEGEGGELDAEDAGFVGDEGGWGGGEVQQHVGEVEGGGGGGGGGEGVLGTGEEFLFEGEFLGRVRGGGG